MQRHNQDSKSSTCGGSETECNNTNPPKKKRKQGTSLD